MGTHYFFLGFKHVDSASSAMTLVTLQTNDQMSSLKVNASFIDE